MNSHRKYFLTAGQKWCMVIDARDARDKTTEETFIFSLIQSDGDT